MKIKYQPYGSLSFLAESYVINICNTIYPPQYISSFITTNCRFQLSSVFLYRPKLQSDISFFSIAPLKLARLSLGC